MPPPSLLGHLESSKDSTALALPYFNCGDEGCNSIARFMRENVLLRTVDLRGNNIRADGLVVLAHALRSSSNLVSLCLKWNQVGSHDRGIKALCDVLRGNTTVTNLDLRNNKIGPECGPVLGQMLKENRGLTHLDLSWNDLGIEGGKALMVGIQANQTIIDCQLSGNRVAEDTLHSIAFVLRRNRQQTPLTTATFKEGKESEPPLDRNVISGTSDVIVPSFGPPGDRDSNALARTQPKARVVQNEGLALKLLQKEQNYTNAEDARFFGEVAEYIDLLQLDAARNKKYRLDAEERERVVTKGFMQREMKYAQEMRELENLLAKAKSEKDELLQDSEYLQHEIERVKEERAKTVQDRRQLEEVSRFTADRLRCDIRDGLAVKADLETQIFKVKRRQQEQEEENARLRTYLGKCKADLDRALR